MASAPPALPPSIAATIAAAEAAAAAQLPSAGASSSSSSAAAAAARACRDSAQQLVLCLERAPCVAQRQRSIRQCLAAGDFEGCEALRRGHFECRRSQLDMRARIHGRTHQDRGGGGDI
jgi:cytochrome c oxidase assembly factor 5